jgi:hypothetical protein
MLAVSSPMPEELTRSSVDQSETKSWKQASCEAFWKFTGWMKAKAKGRILFSFLLCCLWIYVITRPAFATLCSKVIVLMLRGFISRCILLIASIVDGILDEAVSQFEATVQPPLGLQESSKTVQINQDLTSLWHGWSHLLCIFLGVFFGRRPLLAQTA